MMQRIAIAATLAFATATTTPALAVDFTGAGATFPAPIYQKWGEEYAKTGGGLLNYQGIGSSGGVNQITNRTVDFGASDTPVSSDNLTKGNLLQFPAVMGSVVVIVNLPGVQDMQLKLTGEIVSDIYAGRITRWNDPRLVEMNRGVTLPSVAIAPAYRADGSGTTFIFTSYLSAVSPSWKDGVGAGNSVKWPTGSGARGNPGVAGLVQNTRGAIGYVENIYASQNKLITTQLRNKSGNFVQPTTANFLAAAANADWTVANFATSIIDVQGADAWPIVSPTFILLPTNPTDAAKTTETLKFFDWAFRSGDEVTRGLEYIPLPQSVKDAVRVKWRELRGPNGQPLYQPAGS